MLRLGIILFSFAILMLLVHTFVWITAKNHLLEFDEECTFEGIRYGFNSLVITNLQMPGIGISCKELSVFLGGDF